MASRIQNGRIRLLATHLTALILCAMVVSLDRPIRQAATVLIWQAVDCHIINTDIANYIGDNFVE